MADPLTARRALIWAMEQEAQRNAGNSPWGGSIPGTQGIIEERVARMSDEEVAAALYSGFRQGIPAYRNALNVVDKSTGDALEKAMMRDRAQAIINQNVKKAVNQVVAPPITSSVQEMNPPLTTIPQAVSPPVTPQKATPQSKKEIWDYITKNITPAFEKAGPTRINPETGEEEVTAEALALNHWLKIYTTAPEEEKGITEREQLQNELLRKQIGSVGAGQAAEWQRIAMAQEQQRIENEREQTKMAMSALGTLGNWQNQAAREMLVPGSFPVPENMKYMPGWEPGGPVESSYRGLGLNYTPVELQGVNVNLNPAEQYAPLLRALAGLGG